MQKIVRITTLFIPFFLFAQNVDMYLSLLHEGQTDGVKEYLPELISKYPNDPGVRYLQALMTSDGMKSFIGSTMPDRMKSLFSKTTPFKFRFLLEQQQELKLEVQEQEQGQEQKRRQRG